MSPGQKVQVSTIHNGLIWDATIVSLGQRWMTVELDGTQGRLIFDLSTGKSRYGVYKLV